MKREEAIKLLNKWYGLFPSEEYEALDMAIEALSNAGQHVQHVGSVDLISRQDAIKIVDQFSREEMFHYMESLELDVRATQICHSAIEAVGTIKEQIESLPSADRPTGWIPVSERLPEDSGCVLISIAGDIEFGAYDRQNSDWAIWCDSCWNEGKRADAWMPLPKPYREDGEDKE